MKNTGTAPFIMMMQHYVRDVSLKDGKSAVFGTEALEVKALRAAAAAAENKLTAEMVYDIGLFRWLWPDDMGTTYKELIAKAADAKAVKLSKLSAVSGAGSDVQLNKRVLDSAYSMFVSEVAGGASSSARKK